MSSAKVTVPQVSDNQSAIILPSQQDILPVLAKDLNQHYVKLLTQHIKSVSVSTVAVTIISFSSRSEYNG
jgi:hypothetical protein